MNLTILLIAAYLPLPLLLFMILRSGSFGKGSIGTMLKLFFLGVAAAVPAFLMEAACLLVIKILLGLFPEGSFGGHLPVVGAILRYFIAVALIEEGWKHFVLRSSTWKQMIMENITDGTAASALVGVGFSAVMYGAWIAAYYVVPADMEVLRDAMPDYFGTGMVTVFLIGLVFIFSHFGYSGLMGAFYGIAKNSEQKDHGKRAGFLLFVSFTLAFLMHGFCAALTGYGVSADLMIWVMIGLALEVILGLLMASMLGRASDAGSVDTYSSPAHPPVDFSDSEEFASFAESAGNADGTWDPDADQDQDEDRDEGQSMAQETAQGMAQETAQGMAQETAQDLSMDTGRDSDPVCGSDAEPDFGQDPDPGQSLDGDLSEDPDTAQDGGLLKILPFKKW